MDIAGTIQYLQLTTRDWMQPLFQNIRNGQACMFRSSWLFIDTPLMVIYFRIIATSNIDLVVSIRHKTYSMQFFLIHIKSVLPLLHVATCTKSMQRTWWPCSEYCLCHWMLFSMCLKTAIKPPFFSELLQWCCMSVMVSQITGQSSVCSAFCSG